MILKFLKSSFYFSFLLVTVCSIALSNNLVIPLTPDTLNLKSPDTLKTVQKSDSAKSVDTNSTNKAQKNQIVGFDSTLKPVVLSSKTNESDFKLKQSWSYSLPMEITGVTICDINNDKKMEIVLASSNRLIAFQYKNKSLAQVAEYKASRGTQILSVDGADLNHNGSAELYVTSSASDGTSLNSFIGEFENEKFNIFKKGMNSFLRVIPTSDSTQVVLGQDFSDKGVQFGKLFHIKVDGKNVSFQDKIPFPKEHCLISLSSYYDAKEKALYYLCYNSHSNVELINFNTYKSESESSDKFSGNPLYMILPSVSPSEQNSSDRSYLPLRTLSADLNNDGSNEIIAIKNYELTGNMLNSFKVYLKNHIEIFDLVDGFTLKTLWKSNKTDGYISDYAFGDFENNGKNELITIKVLKSDANMFHKPLSEITSYTVQ